MRARYASENGLFLPAFVEWHRRRRGRERMRKERCHPAVGLANPTSGNDTSSPIVQRHVWLGLSRQVSRQKAADFEGLVENARPVTMSCRIVEPHHEAAAPRERNGAARLEQHGTRASAVSAAHPQVGTRIWSAVPETRLPELTCGEVDRPCSCGSAGGRVPPAIRTTPWVRGEPRASVVCPAHVTVFR